MPTASGAITTSCAPGSEGSRRSSTAIAPTPSVTAARMRSAPDFRRRLDDQLELGDLLLAGERVPLDGRGKAALWREAQLLDRHVPRRLLDPPLEQILRFQLAALGCHEAEHHVLVRRHVTQRLEPARARVVVL